MITLDTAFKFDSEKIRSFIGWRDLSSTRNRFSPRRKAIVGRPVINQRWKRSSDRREINAGGSGSIFLFLYTSLLSARA